MGNATEVRSCLTEHLENLCQELRNKVEKSLGYPTLQATVLSQHSQGQILSACWQFNISGKYFFTLDTVTMSWRPTNAVSGDIMNKWKGDEDLMKHLTFSIAECSQKLNEFFKQHKEKPGSTTRSPDITQVTSPTQLPPTGHTPYKEVFIPVGLIIFFIICIYRYVKRKCCTQGGTHRTTDDANRLRLDGSDFLGTTKGPGLGIEMLHSVAEKDTDISVRNKIGVGVDGSDRKPYDNAISILVASNLEDISNSARSYATVLSAETTNLEVKGETLDFSPALDPHCFRPLVVAIENSEIQTHQS
ncbi:retinoic acid early-inducible protein 1-beta-like [Apodemus sylvaticus]|uniref:retinoic acid early-inducible protein 1-beta-like n=1 Tax=Apodemus sylvaticus TaxID=10129 RepID=UPI00224329FB|nr:retinoic acid early-inducible protein 1-beta-like [Apodemus sylvaticus]